MRPERLLTVADDIRGPDRPGRVNAAFAVGSRSLEMSPNQKASLRICQVLIVVMAVFAIANAVVGDWLAVASFGVIAASLLLAVRQIRRRPDRGAAARASR